VAAGPALSYEIPDGRPERALQVFFVLDRLAGHHHDRDRFVHDFIAHPLAQEAGVLAPVDRRAQLGAAGL
jgi:hypothetical protein